MDFDDFDPGNYLEEPAIVYEREREFMARSHGGLSVGLPTVEPGNKICVECGVEFTRARRSDTCLRCA